MRMVYQQHEMDDVFRYFVKGLKPPNGKIVSWEPCYDPRTGKVIFTLILDDVKNEAK